MTVYKTLDDLIQELVKNPGEPWIRHNGGEALVFDERSGDIFHIEGEDIILPMVADRLFSLAVIRLVGIGHEYKLDQLPGGTFRFRYWRKGSRWEVRGSLNNIGANVLAWADCRESGELNNETVFAQRGWEEDGPTHGPTPNQHWE